MLETAVEINDVKKIYNSFAMPAAAVDGEGRLIYYNDAFDGILADGFRPSAMVHKGAAYDKYIDVCGREYRMYVTPYDNMSVAMFFPCSSSVGISSELAASVRSAVEGITFAAEELISGAGSSEDSEKKAPDMETVRRVLNFIDRSGMTLLSEFLIPEQIQVLRSADINDYPAVSVSEELKKYAGSIQETMVSQPVGMSVNIATGMFAQIDITALKLILTDHISWCLGNGEYDVDGIGLKLSRRGENKMLLTLSCSVISKRNRRFDTGSASKIHDDSLKELLDLMEGKFGCVTTVTEDTECRTLCIELNCAEAPREEILRFPAKSYLLQSRYSNENIMLARFEMNPRY